jgi:hypothetical protein
MGANQSAPSIVDIEKKDDKLVFKRIDDTKVEIPIDTNSITQTYVDAMGNLFIKRTDGNTDGPFKVKSDVVGPPGKDGDTITSVDVSPGGFLTLKKSDGMTFGPFNVKGVPGTGIQGPQGDSIANATVTDGILTLENTNGNKYGPFSVKGPQGIQGIQGVQGDGIASVDVTPTGLASVGLTNGKTFGPYNIKGSQGIQGVAGKDFPVDYEQFTNVADFKYFGDWELVDRNSVAWGPLRGVGRTGASYTKGFDNQNLDAVSAVVQVPIGVKSGYLMYLPFPNCRFFDIFGTTDKNIDVFINRINAYTVYNGGEQATTVTIPRVDRFTSIKIQGRRGRIHLLGIGWASTAVAGASPSGFMNFDNVVGVDSINMNRLCDANGNGCVYLADLQRLTRVVTGDSNGDVRINHGNTSTNFAGNKTIYFPSHINTQGGNIESANMVYANGVQTGDISAANVFANGEVQSKVALRAKNWRITSDGDAMTFKEDGKGDRRYAMFGDRYTDL